MKKNKPLFIPPIRQHDEGWIKQGNDLYELYEVNEHDHEGHCWLYASGRTADNKLEGEWISYDEGETWEDPDMNGYW